MAPDLFDKLSSELSADQRNQLVAEKQNGVESLLRSVEVAEMELEEDAGEAMAIANGCMQGLSRAMPALEGAMDALERLDKAAICGLRDLAEPPELVVNTMCAVMALMQKSSCWGVVKAELHDASFLNKIKGFDKDNISDTTMHNISKYINDPNFTPAAVARISPAAGALCEWVHAINIYHGVARNIEPQRLKLQEAQEALGKKQQQLQRSKECAAKAQELLKELEMKVAELDGFCIDIQQLSGTAIQIKVTERTAVADVQLLIQDQLGIIPMNQDLFLSETHLADLQIKMRDLDIAPDSVLTLVVKSGAAEALEVASKALKALDRRDLTEIKTMALPPEPLMITCMCVVILRPLGKEEESAGWAGCKAMLADVNILNALAEYKKDDLQAVQIDRVEKLLSRMDKDMLETREMTRVSKAGDALLQWVLAMICYYHAHVV